jgi:hypothetical protein
MIFWHKFRFKRVLISAILNCLIISSSVFLSGCFVANEVEVKTKKSSKTKSNFNNLPVTVSNVEIINHQVVITGTNLSAINKFVIKEGAVLSTLQIESQTSNKIIANTLTNVTFAAGKILDFILSNADAASTFTVNFSLCDSTLGGKAFNCLITPNDKEVLSYDAASGKWKPRAMNGLSYQGSWDALNDPQPTTTAAGDYFIVSVANGPFNVGDWIVFNGMTYDQISNSNTITNVFGRTGVITATEADYNLDKMSDVDLQTAPPLTGDILKYNGTKWVPGVVSAGSGGTVTNVTASGPISVTSGASTPAISISQANTTTNGYLTNTDWNTFNNKQPAITAGTTAQYYRGDKTWQTLDTLAVPENTNLYFTNARVLGVPLLGFTTATGAVVATDSVLDAFGKLQGQLNQKSDSASYVDWATSGLQTIDPSRLSLGAGDANKVIVTSGTGFVTAGGATATEVGYLNGVTSNIQTQLSAKQTTISKSTVQDVSKLRIYGANISNYVEMSAATLTGNRTLIFPDSNGANGNVLTTDGSGVLSWSSLATSSPVTSVNTQTGAVSLTTTNIAEGTNLYYTNARGIASTITAPTLTNSAVATGDTLQVVVGKLQAQFNNVLNIALTGLSTATSSAITAADTIIDGFGKLQAQLNTVSASNANKLSKNSNDSITATVTVSGAGDIIVPSTPAGMTSAVNKTYVEDRIANANNQWSVGGGNVYRSTGFVGIGTASPITIFDVAGGTGNTAARFTNYGNIAHLGIQRAEGTQGTPTNISAAGTDIGGLSAAAYDGSAFQTLGWMRFSAETAITGSANTAGYISMATRPTGSAGSLERLRITSAGNIGIGTTTPGTNLHITGASPALVSDGQIILQGSETTGAAGTGAGITFTGSDGVSHTRAWGSVQSYKENSTVGDVASFMRFSTRQSGLGAAEKMRINSLGNVGIGTTTPIAKLTVTTPLLQGQTAIYLNSLDLGFSNDVGAGGPPQFLLLFPYYNGVNSNAAGYSGKVRCLRGNSTAGNTPFEYDIVGQTAYSQTIASINARGTSPGAKLYSVTYSGIPYLAIRLTEVNGSGCEISLEGQFWNAVNAQTPTLVLESATSAITVASDYQYVGKDIFNKGGNVGIGEVNPSAKLDIAGAIKFASGKGYLGYYNVNPYDQAEIGAIGATSSLSLVTNGVSRLNILPTNGYVGIGTVSPGYSLDVNGSIAAIGALQAHSDIKLKKNIVPVSGALEKLKSIKGVTYDWRIDEYPNLRFEDRRQMGVIAQDVKKVFPEAVAQNKDGILSVAYTMLIAPLVEGVKELYNRVLGIEAKQSVQSRKIASLEVDNKTKDIKIKKLEEENNEIKARLERIERALKVK